MPPAFKFPEVAELWVPLAIDTSVDTQRPRLGCDRALKTRRHARTGAGRDDVIARRIEEQNPVTNEGMGVILTLLREGLVSGDYRRALLILLGSSDLCC